METNQFKNIEDLNSFMAGGGFDKLTNSLKKSLDQVNDFRNNHLDGVNSIKMKSEKIGGKEVGVILGTNNRVILVFKDEATASKMYDTAHLLINYALEHPIKKSFFSKFKKLFKK